MYIQDTFNEICSFCYQQEILSLSRTCKLFLSFKNNFPNYLKERFLKFHNHVSCFQYSCSVDFTNYGKIPLEAVFTYACLNGNDIIVEKIIKNVRTKNKDEDFSNTFKKILNNDLKKKQDAMIHNGLLICLTFGRTTILKYFLDFFNAQNELKKILILAIEITVSTDILDEIIKRINRYNKFIKNVSYIEKLPIEICNMIDSYLSQKKKVSDVQMRNSVYVLSNSKFKFDNEDILPLIYGGIEETPFVAFFCNGKKGTRKKKINKFIKTFSKYFANKIKFENDYEKRYRYYGIRLSLLNRSSTTIEKYIYFKDENTMMPGKLKDKKVLEYYGTTVYDYFFRKNNSSTIIYNINVGDYKSFFSFGEDFVSKLLFYDSENKLEQQMNEMMYTDKEVEKIISSEKDVSKKDNYSTFSYNDYSSDELVSCCLLALRKNMKIDSEIYSKFISKGADYIKNFYEISLNEWVKNNAYNHDDLVFYIQNIGKIPWYIFRCVFMYNTYDDFFRLTELLEKNQILQKYYIPEMINDINYAPNIYESVAFEKYIEKYIFKLSEQGKLCYESKKKILLTNNKKFKTLRKEYLEKIFDENIIGVVTDITTDTNEYLLLEKYVIENIPKQTNISDATKKKLLNTKNLKIKEVAQKFISLS